MEKLTADERGIIEEVLGAEWLRRQSDRFIMRVEQSCRKANDGRALVLPVAHPLTPSWLIATGRAADVLDIQNDGEHLESMRLLAKTLGAVWPTLDDHGRQSLRERLKNRDHEQFEQTYYELRVAELYVGAGMKIRMIPQDSSTYAGKNSRRPDFAVLLEERLVYVECKKKQMVTQRDRDLDAFWQQFAPRLDQLLKDAQRSVAVRITALRTPQLSELNRLLELMRALLAFPSDGPFHFEGLIFSIQAIAPWGTPIPAPISFYQASTDKIYIQVDRVPVTGGGTVGQNLRILYLEDPQLIDRRPGIRTTLDSARRQLVEDQCNVVYIELPVAPNQRFGAVADYLVPYLQGLLKFENQRINAVVLTASGFLMAETGRIEHRFRSRVVWHAAPRTPLPAEFTIPSN